MRKTDVGKESQRDRDATGGQRSLFREQPSGFLPEETPEENLSSKHAYTGEQSDILGFHGDRQFSQHAIWLGVVCITASIKEPGIGQDHKSGTVLYYNTCSFLTLCLKENCRDLRSDWDCGACFIGAGPCCNNYVFWKSIFLNFPQCWGLNSGH